jgi:hypothetical protein
MGKIAIKLADLTRQVAELEAQLAIHAGQAAGVQAHGPSNAVADQATAAMQKRLWSLRRSCEILARHA